MALASESTTAPKWRRTRQGRWASDGSPSLGFELDAEREVPVWMNRVRPILAVRCLSRSVEVFVVMGTSASIEAGADRHTVRVSLDDDPEAAQQWLESTDKQALFTPDPESLAQRIAGARRMRFGFTPFNASPVTADFDVRGFQELLDTMSRTCRPPAKRPKA